MNKSVRTFADVPLFSRHVDPRGGPNSPPPFLFFFSWKEEGRPEFLGAERRPAVLRFRLEANVGAEVSEEGAGGRGGAGGTRRERIDAGDVTACKWTETRTSAEGQQPGWGGCSGILG